VFSSNQYLSRILNKTEVFCLALYPFPLSARVHSSSHDHPGFLYNLPILFISVQLTTHVVNNEQKKISCRLHPKSSSGMNNIECSIHHLASSCISSYIEVAPLSSRKISSVSLLDSEWRNLRDSIVPESILSSKGQFAWSKLSINRDTWTTHKSVVIVEIQGRRI